MTVPIPSEPKPQSEEEYLDSRYQAPDAPIKQEQQQQQTTGTSMKSQTTYQEYNNNDSYNDKNPATTSSLQYLLSSSLDIINTYILPPHIRATISYTARSHPLLSTFLLCQFVCSCVPVCMFLVGAMIAATVAVVMFSCVALFVLGPVLMVTSFVGACLWGWGWVIYVVGKWLVEKYLDGSGDEKYRHGKVEAAKNGALTVKERKALG